MRVLFIENTGNKSAGAFHSMITLIKLLKNYGVESYVAVSDKADGLELLEQNKIPYIKMRVCAYTWIISNNAKSLEQLKMPLKYVVSKLASWKLIKYAKENEIEIIHENTSACYIGAFVAKHLKVPHVWHIREFLEEDFNASFWWKKNALWMINHSDAVITVSNAISQKYEGKIRKDLIHRIYNGIDVETFFCQKPEYRLNDSCNILCVGRVCEGKGQADVIRALTILKEKYLYEPQLYIAGIYSKEYKNSIIQSARKVNILNNIHFLGQCNDMKKLYGDMDILCMSSRKEAFGRVTVEAMLSGLLVVGANSGGTAEIITEGKTGYLYEVGDADQLASKLAYVFQKSNEAERVAICGQRHARNHYDAQINARQVYELYNKILQG